MTHLPSSPTTAGEGAAGIATASPDGASPPSTPLERLRTLHHPRCFVARDHEDFGLGVQFSLHPDSGVEATVSCPASWEGYAGLVHGGIIASLLDGAMTNALFARSTVAVTAEVKIRYRRPLRVGQPATVEARVTQCEPPLYIVEARVTSEEGVHATCTGKFMRMSEVRSGGGAAR
jgi:uncharacterized protein (TIGR00369 family)